MRKEGMYPKNFRDCFHMDKDEINPIPRGILRKIYTLSTSSRYSMPVYMRLAQYFYIKRESSNNKISILFWTVLSNYYSRKNQVLNNFEVSKATCYIMGGGSVPSYCCLYYK